MKHFEEKEERKPDQQELPPATRNSAFTLRLLQLLTFGDILDSNLGLLESAPPGLGEH